MLKNVRLLKKENPTKVHSINQHPREFLEVVLSAVIYQLYGFEQAVHIAHPQHPLNIKAAHTIDYVFTCFEVANRIGHPAPKISDEVAAQVIKWFSKKRPEMLENIKLQSLNGYINFELSEAYLSEAAYYAAHWLQKPEERRKTNRQVRILIEGPHLAQETSNSVVDKTFFFVRELYAAVGYKVSAQYLISDVTEDAARSASPALMKSRTFRLLPKGHNAEVESAQFERQVRSILGGLVHDEKDEGLEGRVEKLRKSFYLDCVKELKDYQLDPKDIQKESDLTHKVQNWLDEIAGKRDHIIVDPDTKALYYHIPLGPMTSLRTAHGSLFRVAYLLYDLDMFLMRAKHSQELCVSIVPKKYHQLLYGDADLTASGISYKRFICIDPMLVESELPSHIKNKGAFDAVSRKIAHALAGGIANKVHTSQSRSELLTLIDFPVELNHLARQVRMLEAFALIQGALNDVELLSRTGPDAPKLRGYRG